MMEDIKQKKKMLLEVLLVMIFFILVICGLIFAYQNILQSKPVQSAITFIHDEETLIKQYVTDTKLSITQFLDETQYRMSDLAPWLHLKQRPSITPEVPLENNDIDPSSQSEHNTQDTTQSNTLKSEDVTTSTQN